MLAALLLAFAPPPQAPSLVLPLREQAAVRDRWLSERIVQLAPALMREQGIDLWIVAAQPSRSPAAWSR